MQLYLMISSNLATARVPNTSDPVQHKRHYCDTNDTSATRLKIFNFDNATSESLQVKDYK